MIDVSYYSTRGDFQCVWGGGGGGGGANYETCIRILILGYYAILMICVISFVSREHLNPLRVFIAGGKLNLEANPLAV